MRASLASILLVTGCGSDDNASPGGESESESEAEAEAEAEGELTFDTKPCGGDVEGTWVVDEVSIEFGPPNECPTATLATQAAAVEGTIEFAAGGAFSQELTLTATVAIGWPTECLDGGTCDDFVAGLTEGDDSPVTEITCEEVATGCDCVAELGGTMSMEGTWEAGGTTLTTTTPNDSGGEDTGEADYCVEGDQLWAHSADTDQTMTFLAHRQ